MLSEGKAENRDNPFLNRFFTFDFVSVLVIVISLMALLFTHDICTGEKETGTLKMMFSNPVSRASVLAGKILGTFFTLLPMLLFSYGLCILVILLYPEIHFTASEWMRIGLIFLLSIVSLLLFMVIGLFVSSGVQNSGTSIVICLVLWVTFLFIIPNLANYSAKSFVNTGSIENLKFKMKELDEEYLKKTWEYENKLPQPDWEFVWNSQRNIDGTTLIGGASKSFFEKTKLSKEYAEPLRVDYADKKWSFCKGYLANLENQQRFAQYISFLSPSQLFKESVNRLCGTSAQNHYLFMDQTRQYREDLIRYYKNNQFFSSYLYFTQQEQKSFMTADEMVKTLTKGEIKSVTELNNVKNGWNLMNKGTLPDYDWNKWRNLDLSNFPQFSYRSTGFQEDINHSLIHIGVMSALALLLFYLSFRSFIKYDVR